MAHNQLAEQLDQLNAQDLGMEFDEMATWSKLESRLDNRKGAAFWWIAAACLLVGLVFLPISVLKEQTVQENTIAEEVDTPVFQTPIQPMEVEAQETPRPVKELNVVERRGLANGPLLASIPDVQLSLEPLAIPKNKRNKSAFAAEDISVIQASLERPKTESGRTMSIRAQWQTSPEKLNVNYQALKIKLYDKE